MEISDYRVQTDFFEGPLDLLLHLIRKKRMNILEVRLGEITAEYLAYLELREMINPSRESEFLLTAATLIYIKSTSLLPKPETLQDESPEDHLMHTLAEFEKIKRISGLLRQMEDVELLLWRREAISENFVNKEFDITEVSAFQLAEIFFNIVKKKEREEFLYISSKNYSIAGKQKEILALLEENDYLDFSDYILKLDSIEDILVSFFTLLEMIKCHQLIAIQKKLFERIAVWKMPQMAH